MVWRSNRSRHAHPHIRAHDPQLQYPMKLMGRGIMGGLGFVYIKVRDDD